MKPWKLVVPALALVGVAIAFAACGGGDDKPGTGTVTATSAPTRTTIVTTSVHGGTNSPGASADASTLTIAECDLVQPSELQTLINDTFEAGFPAGDICTFLGAGGATVQIVTYQLGADPKAEFEDIPLVFDDIILDEPGDEAYYDPALGLSVLAGNIELNIHVNAADSTDLRGPAFAIADLALPRLP